MKGSVGKKPKSMRIFFLHVGFFVLYNINLKKKALYKRTKPKSHVENNAWGQEDLCL